MVTMATVTIRYWAAAKEAAGVAAEPLAATTLAEALTAALARHGKDARLAAVLNRSSFLVDGAPVGRRPHDEVALRDDDVVEVLPPFAGG